MKDNETYIEKASYTWSDDSIRLILTPSYKTKSLYLYIQEIGYFKTIPPYFTERKNLNSFLIMYTICGKGRLKYLDKEFILKPGSIAYINCMEEHKYENYDGGEWEFLWVHINGNNALGYYQEFIENEFNIIDIKNKEKIRDLFLEMIKINQKKNITTDVSTGDDKDADDGKSVAIAKEIDAISMNSMYATDGTSFEMIHAFVDGLMDTDAEGNIINALAEEYTESEDGLVYTFTIRDAEWSNGTKVTANDFAFAWKTAIVNEAAEYAYLFGASGANVLNAEAILNGEADVEDLGIVALDETTLQVTLETKTPYFLSLMAFPVFFPVNEEFFVAQGDNGSDYGLLPENTIACGAYKLVGWERDTKISYVKNDTYWDAENVNIDKLTFNIISDTSSAAVAFKAKEVAFTKISSDIVDGYLDSEEYTQLLDGYLWYLQPNLDDEVMNNLNFRLALAYATDKADICNNVLKDGSVIGNGFVPTNLSTGPDGKDFRATAGDFYATDLALAQEYFAKALTDLGVDSITMKLTYETADPAKTVAEYLQATLMANLPGLTVEMDAQSKEARIELQKAGEFQVALTRWGPDYADPTTYLNLMITGNSYNYGNYSSVEFDDLMTSAGTTADMAERWNNLVEAEKVLMEDLPVIAIFQVGGASLLSSDVTGLEVHTVGVPYNYKNLDIVE